MAYALVSSVVATPGAAGGTTSPINTTGATLLLISAHWYQQAGTPAPTDNKGNTWVPLTRRQLSIANHQFFYCLTPIVGTGHTFTLNSVFGYPVLQVYAFSGAGAFRVQSGATVTSGTSLACGSVTPTQADSLVVAALCAVSTVATDSISPAGMGTPTTRAFGAGTNVQGSVSVHLAAPASAINPTWSWTPGGSSEIVVATAVFDPAAPTTGTVPNVVGQTEAAATTSLTGAGFIKGTVTTANHATVAVGLVISQSPASGTTQTLGSAVALVVSLGPAMVTVPNVVGQSQVGATTVLTSAGFTIGTVTQVHHPSIGASLVISQTPAAASSASAGSAVALEVSLGPAPTRLYPSTIIPNVRMVGVPKGSWSQAGVYSELDNPYAWTWRLSPEKLNPVTRVNAGVHAAFRWATNQQGNYDLFAARWTTAPLAAQTIAGTLDWCALDYSYWEGVAGTAVCKRKLHVYLAQGQTLTPRAVLLDNYVEPGTMPGSGFGSWRTVSATLTPATAQAGDVLVIEFGARIVSSPTPVPTYPPTDHTHIHLNGNGTNSFSQTTHLYTAKPDAVAGDSDANMAPWLQFSTVLSFLPPPPAPIHGTQADPILIPSTLPYESPLIDTSQAPEADRAIWFDWTAPLDGEVMFHAYASTYLVYFLVHDAVEGDIGLTESSQFRPQRSHTHTRFMARAGTTYHIKTWTGTGGLCAQDSGGPLVIAGDYIPLPAKDDLYIASGMLLQVRNGRVVAASADLSGYAPTGIGIDYTKRPIQDQNEDEAGNPLIHAGERLVVGLHSFGLLEVLDLPTLNHHTPEVTYIGDALGNLDNVAQIHVTRAGQVVTAGFGNGYLYVAGPDGGLPASMNTISDDPTLDGFRVVDATHGDGQPAAPFPVVVPQLPAVEVTAPWAIAVDEPSGVAYYTSGSLYIAVGGQTIKRWNLATQTQLPDFATVPLDLSVMAPSLRGLALLPGGEVLVCNGSRVDQLSSAGVVTRSFTPSVREESQRLVDVVLTADGQSFWTIDLTTTRLFKFSLTTGEETLTAQAYAHTGGVVQMVMYDNNPAEPPPVEPPPHECECCVATKLSVINDALFKVGVSRSIESLTEPSREAITAVHHFDKVLKETLRQHPWAFATKYADSLQAVLLTDPMAILKGGQMVGGHVQGTLPSAAGADWQFAYRYPEDCLFARRIVPATGRTDSYHPIPFRVGRRWDVDPDDATLYIFTNQPDAVLEYTAFVECAAKFADALFEDALSWRLASKLAPSLARDSKLHEKCWTMYLHTLDTAAARTEGEGQQHQPGDVDWIKGRQ